MQATSPAPDAPGAQLPSDTQVATVGPGQRATPWRSAAQPRIPTASGASFALPSILMILFLSVAGCGYGHSDVASAKSSGYRWGSLYRDDVRTVAVPIFTNRSFRRGVEFSLSKAIVNQLEATTPYKVVSREHADTVLEGEILDIHTRTLSPDVRTGVPQEQLYIVRVNFTWKDLRSGKILVDRRRFEQSTTYYPTLGEGQFVGSQQNVERLGVAIVQELQADW